VIRLLERAASAAPALTRPDDSAETTEPPDPEEIKPVGLTRPSTDSSPPQRDDLFEIPAGGVTLSGHLVIPPHARGVVIFVHGSGSSRHSPRNRRVAEELNESGLGTLLFDLLTGDEERDRANVFDIPALAARLIDVTAWLVEQPGLAASGLGYFGASTGAAAALWAAAEPRSPASAVVSRGGRPDLAGDRLPAVVAPTLLIVGDRDPIVLELNRQAQRQLRCENHLAIVPGATHLFEEPGALQTVTRLARDRFTEHMADV
jgi:putative phosphoribosyl transferase